MLQTKNILVLGALIIGMSCSNSTEVKPQDKAPVKTEQSVKKSSTDKRFLANVSDSKINWKGHKIMGSHGGVLDLKSGYLEGSKSHISGGSFVVDMTSIRAEELMDGGDDKDKSDLAAHLRDGDFFDAPNYPTAKFVVSTTKNIGQQIEITGHMTIKDVTKPITFLSTWSNGRLQAKVEVDRTKFNIKYGSGSFFDDLGDRAIKDNFTLDINIPFKM